ncbi:FAD dependent oxidoreductase [Advenella kashmirensis W13003]|uniref:FAD dependent oxidoreductase n=1 Tax=Advenella kashmirensis W13003 TaxID=1424334 RepID=V8QXK4_9BURK|nr:FAD-binding oxidoreductase [Advenella kashmirensis]ETF04387.1 FAD dependent oxidoreductase [Advenella kashmirensis W13003]
MSLKTPFLPYYSSRSGWNALLPARTAMTEPQGVRAFDYIVIGAGFTGLSAARRLAELAPEKTVLILEGSVIGEGSSSRNSGFMSTFPRSGIVKDPAQDDLLGLSQIGVYEQGLQWLKGTLQQNRIECDWDEGSGKYNAAATPAGKAALRAGIEKNTRLGIDSEVLGQDQLQQRLGTRYYTFGYYTRNNVFVQPAAMHRGLADTLSENVTLLEETFAQRISGSPGHFIVATSKGDFSAGQVVIANNAFARKLGFLKDRLIAIYTYAGLTPALSDEQAAELGPARQWGVLPAHRLGTTLRKVSGNRFMVRSAYSYEAEQSVSAYTRMLTHYYKRRFPQMKSHEFEFVWGGTTALTRNGGIFFGKLAEGIYGSLGCNGSGVLRGTVNGRLLADLMLNQRSAELDAVLALGGPSWLPPEPLRALGVKSAIFYQGLKASAER